MQTRLTQAVATLGNARIIVVGDAMLDRFVYGFVTRTSPEAPVPVLLIDRETALPGGAANVAHNATALGGGAIFISVVGDDQDGSDLVRLVSEDTRIEPCFLTEKGRITTRKTRYVSSGQQIVRADRETTKAIAESSADQILERVSNVLTSGDVLVLSDYAKGVFAGDLPRRLIDAAHVAGAIVVVDPKGRDYGRYRGADFITPNRKELSEATGASVDTEEQIVEAAEALLRLHGFGSVLVTRSENGMSLISSGSQHHFPAEAIEVFDVAGAGDTVIATFSLALSAGIDVLDATRLANVAAGIAVAKVGTAKVRPDELGEALQPSTGALRKIVLLPAAAEAAERWRQRGWRIGFTNGCFDLLHPGHVHILEQARANCDRLIVGLNADSSIRKLKDPSRPIQDEKARATILASLATVDLVCLFEEDTPLALIEAIRPEVLIKGADYTMETVVGRSLVQSWGGQVMLAEWLPGHSTSATVAKLRHEPNALHQ